MRKLGQFCGRWYGLLTIVLLSVLITAGGMAAAIPQSRAWVADTAIEGYHKVFGEPPVPEPPSRPWYKLDLPRSW